MALSLLGAALVISGWGSLSLDARSAGLGRCFLGALAFLDILGSRWPLRQLFYCDGPVSIWPRALVGANKDPQIHYQDLLWQGVYMWSGSPLVVSTLMVIAGIASLMVCVGFYTHMATFICWVHLYSLSTRCSGITQAGDTLLRLLMFWLMWLPCEMHYSIDAMLIDSASNQPTAHASIEGTQNKNILSLASAAILIQLSLLYQTPAAFKIDFLWTAPTVSDNAIYYVLANKSFRRDNFVTYTLLRYPHVLKCLTSITPWLEHAAPIFIFGGNIPYVRTIGVIAFVGFHLGLHLTMTLGLFPWTCIAGWSMLLPPELWNQGSAIPGTNTNAMSSTSQVLPAVSLIYQTFRIVLCSLALLCTVHSCIDCLPGPHQVKRIPNSSDEQDNGNKNSRSIQYKVWRIYAWIYLRLGKIGRCLGVKQQWYLFDKPAASSYWYSVIGKVMMPQRGGNDRDSQCVYDLHKMLRMFVEGRLVLIDGEKNVQYSKVVSSSLAMSSEKLSKDYDKISFESVYGGHRWRKLMQNIGKHPRESGSKRLEGEKWFEGRYGKVLIFCGLLCIKPRVRVADVWS